GGCGRRSTARGRRRSPAPTPTDRLLAVEVPVDHGGRESLGLHEAAKLLDEGNRSVTPAGAPDGHGQIRLALALIRREQEAEQILKSLEEVAAQVVRENELANPRVTAVERPEALYEVRVGQESHVEHQIGVDRDAVPEAERHQRCSQARPRAG